MKRFKVHTITYFIQFSRPKCMSCSMILCCQVKTLSQPINVLGFLWRGKLNKCSEVLGKIERRNQEKKIEFVTYHEKAKLLYLPKIEHSDIVAVLKKKKKGGNSSVSSSFKHILIIRMLYSKSTSQYKISYLARWVSVQWYNIKHNFKIFNRIVQEGSHFLKT